MATVLTTKQVGNSYCPQMRLTVEISRQTNTEATLSWHVDYINYGYALYGTDREVSEKINGTWYDEDTWSHNGKDISYYNIRTGSTTIAKGTASKTIEVKLYWDMSGYTWHGTSMSEWNIAGSIKIDPKPSYKVTYNANSGSGAPSEQTKWYGTNITLSSAIPTRENYNFLGWNTAQDGSGTAYAPGATYSANAAATLYAQWELAFIAPTISNFSVLRCLDDGTPDNDGNCARLSFDWSVDLSIHQENEGDTIDVLYSLHNANTWTTDTTIDISGGTSGTVLTVIGISQTYPNGVFNSANSYDIKAIVTDTNGVSRTITDILSQAFFTIDVLAGGHGIAFGMAASLQDTLANAFENLYLKGENDSYTSTLDEFISLLRRIPPASSLLWSGTLTKGNSVTVSGIQNYRLIGCRVNEASSSATNAENRMLIGWVTNPAASSQTRVDCSCSWDDGTSSYLYKSSFAISGNTVTLTSASQHKLVTSGHEGTTLKVREIWGLL